MRVLKHNSLNPVRNSDSRNKAKANQDIVHSAVIRNLSVSLLFPFYLPSPYSLLSPPLFSIPFLLIKSGVITLQCPYIFSDLASGRITELIFGVILICLLH